MFSIPPSCRICGAAIGDLYSHIAWHQMQGHSVTEEAADILANKAKELKQADRASSKKEN